jgi:hypothetical protein
VTSVIFGRHHDKTTLDQAGPPETAVGVHLEWEIEAVQEAVLAFLESPIDDTKQALVADLEKLDTQIDLSDEYAASIVDSPIFGQAPKGAVLGETSSHSMAEDVSSTVVQAQIALVRAAKAAVRDPSPGTLGELRAASNALASMGGQSADT